MKKKRIAILTSFDQISTKNASEEPLLMEVKVRLNSSKESRWRLSSQIIEEGAAPKVNKTEPSKNHKIHWWQREI